MGNQIVNDSIYILRETYSTFKKPAILWSMGKDSTALLHMTKTAFLGKVPFPVIHIDTGVKFWNMYQFRDTWSKEWNLDLRVIKGEGEAKPEEKLECCNRLKTEALKRYVEQEGFDALILAIRRDEHGIRAKERYYSVRDNEARWSYANQSLEVWDTHLNNLKDGEHMRVHPILHFRELDVWNYIYENEIPVNPLYYSFQGKRYRSLGCMPCTEPIDSEAVTIPAIIQELKETKIAEREGRAQDKENFMSMQRLRCMGYM